MGEERHPTLEAVSGLSCIGSLTVIISYLYFAHFRRHPSVIVILLCTCDFLYNIDLFSIGISLYYTKSPHLTGSICKAEAIWSHFWAMATVSWYAVISTNVLITLHNPFKSTINYMKFYHLFVWTISGATAIVLIVFHSHLGPVDDGSCAIEAPDDPLWLLFYVPLIIYFIISFITLFYSIKHMSDLNNPNLYKASQRRTMMIRLILVVLIFTVFWMIPVVNGGIQFFQKPKPDERIPYLWLADSLSTRAQGFANALVWLTNPVLIYKLKTRIRCPIKRKRTFSVEDGETQPILLSPTKRKTINNNNYKKKADFNSLDDALRKDIISCILMGLRESVMGNTKDSSQYIGTREFPELLDTDIKMTSAHADESEFRFFDYYPTLFAGIREVDGISNSQYLRSLDPEIFITGANFGVSKGKSGSFFCFSPDKKFILKTVYPEEAKFLSSISVPLYQHFLQNKGTLIAKFYGFHGVQIPYGDVVYMLVMSNVFDSGRKVDETYDIKGSWVGRSTKQKKAIPSSILKDLDLKRKINLAPDLRLTFLKWMSTDVEFLKGLGIIDYSLLLGFHFLKPNKRENEYDERVTPDILMNYSWHKGMLSEDGREIYFAGIIDILQVYNLRKRIERFWKTSLFCQDMRGVSVAPPRVYAERFILKMGSLFHYEK